MEEKLGFDILEEMISEILIRLPVKLLLQCKSVCKQWLSIISNPSFIKFHLHQATIASKNNPTLLALEDGSPAVAFPLIQLSLGDGFVIRVEYEEDNPQHQRHRQLFNEALLDTNAQDLSNSPINFDRLVQPWLYLIFLYHHPVISSCNGIICITNIGFDNIYLWNPSIRKFKKLPAPPPRHTSSVFDGCKLGFGYDSISDDYKVIKFVYYHIYDFVMIAQVYSTNADSWREIPEPLLKNRTIYRGTNIVVNGVMYFDSGDGLISFDLHKEVFGLIPFPSFIQRKRSYIFPSFIKRKRSYVLDFEGSVAMVFESEQGIHLWTLDDVSGQMSWTKKFSIHHDLETGIRLFCYLGSGQFYGKKFFNGYYLYDILYDYQKRETKYYRLGEENVHANLKYTETLVSLDGFKHLE